MKTRILHSMDEINKTRKKRIEEIDWEIQILELKEWKESDILRELFKEQNLLKHKILYNVV